MSVRTDTINLIVNVNGNQAQNQLNDLRKRATDVKLEMENLKKGTDEYKAKAAELKTVTAAMSDLKKQIGITSLTQKELVAELNKLKALRGSVIPFSEEFNQLSNSIKQVESRLYDVRNGVQGFASFMSKFSDELKQVGVLMLGYLGFQFITQQFKNIIMGAGKLSDQLADLRRVAGLTAEEATDLNSSLGKIDTRTSVSALRDIAVVAGKLGVAKKDILGFVEAVDKLVVALGDELGNADEITTQLGKILNVFDGKVNGDNITKLGNAIVELANAGVATGGFISDFTQRVAGIAKASNLSLGATVGLAAGFEELGLRGESSATALQKLLSTIAGDIPTAAKIAGMEVGKFGALFAKEPQEALIKYAEGLVKNKESFSEITASFKDAGEEGARVVQTLQAIGLKGDFLREKVALGNKSITESSAITEAFDLKNQDLGATIDKLGKDFAKLVSSNTLTNFLKGLVQDTSAFINALKGLPKFISDNAITLGILTAAIVAHNFQRLFSIGLMALEKSGIKSLIVSIFELILAEKNAEIATTAFGIVTAVLSGNFKKAAQEFKLLTVLLETNPFGLVLGAIAAVIIAYKTLSSAISTVSAAEKNRQSIQEKMNDSTAEEISKLQFLANVVRDATLSKETQAKALKELIALNPEYLKGLTRENIALSEGKDILDRYINNLKLKASLEATGALRTEYAKKDLELAISQQKAEEALANAPNSILRSAAQKGIDEIKKARTELDALANANDKISKKYMEEQTAGHAVFYVPDDSKKAGSKGPDDSVGAERKRLQAKLDALAAEYETISQYETAARLKNKAKQKDVQAQLDALDFKDAKKSSAEKKAESEHERLLKEAAKFNDDLRKLKLKMDAGELPENEKEVQLLVDKYAELTAKAMDFYKKGISTRKQFNEEETLIEATHQEELFALFQKQLEKKAAAEYEDSLKTSDGYFSDQRNKVGHDYADGIISKKQYESALTTLEEGETANRIVIAKDYAATVKKAAEDVKTFTKKNEDDITKNLVAETEKRHKEDQDENAAYARYQVIVAPPGSNAELDAKKAELKAKFDMEQESADKTSAMYITAQTELNQQLEALDKAYAQTKIDSAFSTAQTVLSSLQGLNDAINNLQNAELQRDANANTIKQRNMALQVKGKLLSQQQYDVQTAAMNLKQQEEELKVKREQATRDKALSIFNATLSGAEAVVKTMASVPFPLNIPLAIAQGVASGIQIAAIEATPLPTLGTGDWLRTGDKHSDPSGGIHALIERDEAVVKADAMTDNTVRTITGTNAQITSAVNASGGGVSWAPGAVLDMPKWRTTTPANINSNMPRIMAQGGVASTNSPQMTTSTAIDFTPLLAEIKGLRQDVANQQTQLTAVVSLQDLNQKQQMYDFIRNTSSMTQ